MAVPVKIAQESGKWIPKLIDAIRFVKKRRDKALDEINRAVRLDQTELVKCYVRPDCQQVIPIDTYSDPRGTGGPENLDEVARRPLLAKIDAFFRDPVPPGLPGRNVLIVLADAGMGKTALLTWLTVRQISILRALLPARRSFVLKKLGKNTIEEIEQIENKYKTILLLDSLDEDPLAYGRVKERLIDILTASNPFRRVLLTCRTQFFPAAVERRGRVRIGGFECQATYLSFFHDRQVEAYLNKRFPTRFWSLPSERLRQRRYREEAGKLIQKMGSLRCRPLLLAYIKDLMNPAEGDPANPHQPGDGAYDSEYAIYDVLVENWLAIQQTKQPRGEKVERFAEKLLRACELLATELTLRQQQALSRRELDLLVAQMPGIEKIEAIDVRGRSLLNLNAEGDYRFAHSSFREFLVAHRILTDLNWPQGLIVPYSDLLVDFLSQGHAGGQAGAFRLQALDLRTAALSGKDLTGADLPEANLAEANLSRAKLVSANLDRADLSNANLMNADLSRASLREADLSRADLSGARVFGADFDGASFNLDHGDRALKQFEVVTLSADGMLLKKQVQWAWHFTEKLGSDVTLEMVDIPAGSFVMGSPIHERGSGGSEGERQHHVTISTFSIGKYAVTQGQWRVIAACPKVGRDLNPDPSQFKRDDRPVERVSWEDAVEFCARLSNKSGKTYRLPTEAEWEYACRAGTQSPFAFGETITPEFVNYNGNYPYGKAAKGEHRGGTVAVGSLGVANAFGLYDMHGNVWEWCQDWYGPYGSEPVIDPTGPSKGKNRVLRGGSWLLDASYCRSACRYYVEPSYRNFDFGFRVVVVPRTR